MLPTTFKSEDDTAYYYESDVTAFSYFAIAEKKGELLLEPEEEQVIAKAEAKAEAISKWLWIGGIIVIVLIVGAVLAAKKKK
jgi:hypothetical protein